MSASAGESEPDREALIPPIIAEPTVGAFTWHECPRCRAGLSVYRGLVSVVTGGGVTAIGEFGACAHCSWTPCPPRTQAGAGGEGGGG